MAPGLDLLDERHILERPGKTTSVPQRGFLNDGTILSAFIVSSLISTIHYKLMHGDLRLERPDFDSP